MRKDPASAALARRSAAVALLAVPLLLPACEAMRRTDPLGLDSVFDPQRFPPRGRDAPRIAPAPPAAPQLVLPEPLREAWPAPAEAEPEPPAEAAQPPVPPFYVPDPPAFEEEPPPRPPETGIAARLRRSPWLTRFWAQLTAGQRDRVARRLGGAREGLPARWDAMGLEDRARLVGG